jgi:hypothetical protein
MQVDAPEAPETIRTLAEGCVRFVQQALGIALDGTPETLPILDHYLGLARDEDARGRDEVLQLIATTAGAYFGEVVRRAVEGARWHLEDADDPSSWRIEFDHVFLSFNPVGMVREAILERDEPGWNAHLEVDARDRPLVEQVFEHLGAVRETDYYRLAVRWEAIQHALAVLEGTALARGETARRFTPEDYRRALTGEPAQSNI